MKKPNKLFVSSFGPSGYELYGKRFIESFLKWADGDLCVYVEGEDMLDGEKFPDVEYRDLLQISGMREFLKLTKFPAARGLLWGGNEIDYRFNVHRFCRKSFAQIDMAHIAKSRGYSDFFWIDADIEFQGPFKAPELGNDFMLYLGREGSHSCTSFLGWNLTFPAWREFFDKYWALYMTGTVVALQEWSDAFIIDWLRLNLEIPSRNLAADLKTTAFCNVFDMVFPHAHHKKGALKEAK